jgi:DNA-binding beta-propeller fold protein YncE
MKIPLMALPVFMILFFACKPQQPAREAMEEKIPTLSRLWATDTVLRTPESVLYDQARDIIYVANVNLNPWEKDGNGFISRLDTKGNILELQWVSGLNGPKGMGILNDHLYVADIDEVVEINLETGTIVNKYFIEGNPTLNDVTVGNGAVYISGSDSNKVFMLKDGNVTLLFEGDFGRPNGLYAESGRLLMITTISSELKAFDLETGQITVLVDSIGHGDGIVPAGDGGYLASSWRGEIFYLAPGWKRIQLLDTRDAEINAADIDYIIDQRMLLVPTFLKNQVVAYRVEK